MILRPLTISEALRLIQLGCQIKREIDDQLGEAVLKIAGGNDSAFAELHDRANVVGRFDIADKVRNLIGGN